MTMRQLSIDGAWSYTPRIHSDERGSFLESYRGGEFEEVVGYRLAVAQSNISVSRRGSLRGIHFADVPPGQAKYVTCVTGAVLDVVVDIRVGSPTFGQWDSVELDTETRRAVFVAEGLGHAFFALSETASLIYLCSEPYSPGREHEINPLDPEIGIDWPSIIPALLSPKDAAAPSLADAMDNGALPLFEDCQAHYAALRSSD